MTTSLPRQRPVPVGDVELCVEEFGDPSDPTVLLVAGAASSMDWWDADLCRRIAAVGRHVVRYDHRDTGRSTTGPAGSPEYGGDVLDRDCVGLIEALGSRPVHLVGLSMGGGIAQGIALRRPELVASLTLIATAPVGGVDWSTLPGPEPALAQRFESPPPDPDWSDRHDVVEWSLDVQRAFAGRIPLDEEWIRLVADDVYDRSHDVSAANNHWIAIERDGDEGDEPLDIRRLTVPTLVVHGTHDPLFPLRHGEVLAEVVPGARLLVVEGMGHQVPPPPTWDLVVPALIEHTGVEAQRG